MSTVDRPREPIIVTGAGGFVGRALVGVLVERGYAVVAVDRDLSSLPAVATRIEGDLLEAATLKAAFADSCSGVVHLATLPGGAAETDPEAAWQVNVEATRRLAAVAADCANRPRFVYASSIAALGDRLPADCVDDAMLPEPGLYYGAHKLIVETWLATLSRRALIDAISLRLPGIVARPAGAMGMKSAFMSDVFHALRAGRPFVAPVSAEATMWIMSARAAAENLAYALTVSGTALPGSRAVNLPALRVTMRELVAAIARETQTSTNLVSYRPDPKLEAQFGAYPPLDAAAATALGFSADADISQLVISADGQVRKTVAMSSSARHQQHGTPFRVVTRRG